jgi:hypothetical protein
LPVKPKSRRYALVERERPKQRSTREIARCVWQEAITDRTMLSAGGLAFFSMFGLLPALAAVGALYGLLIYRQGDRARGFVGYGFDRNEVMLLPEAQEPAHGCTR